MQDNNKLLKSITSDLIRAENIIISKDKKLFINIIPWWLLFLIVWSLIGAFVVGVKLDNALVPFGFIFCSMVVVGYYGDYRDKVYSNLPLVTRERIQSILKKHHTLFSSFDKTESIDEIVTKMETMRLLISKDYLYIKQKRLRVFKKLVKKEILFCTSVLYDLRADLSTRLTEQQSILKQAKSEVSEHIHWTDELNQVSELQQARLDKQIEQFEELQRVLVKI